MRRIFYKRRTFAGGVGSDTGTILIAVLVVITALFLGHSAAGAQLDSAPGTLGLAAEPIGGEAYAIQAFERERNAPGCSRRQPTGGAPK